MAEDKANGNSTIYRATTNQSRFLNGKVTKNLADVVKMIESGEADEFMEEL